MAKTILYNAPCSVILVPIQNVTLLKKVYNHVLMISGTDKTRMSVVVLTTVALYFTKCGRMMKIVWWGAS